MFSRHREIITAQWSKEASWSKTIMESKCLNLKQQYLKCSVADTETSWLDLKGSWIPAGVVGLFSKHSLAIANMAFWNLQSRWLSLRKKQQQAPSVARQSCAARAEPHYTLTQRCLPVFLTYARAKSYECAMEKNAGCCSCWIKEKKARNESVTSSCQTRETDFLSLPQQISML